MSVCILNNSLQFFELVILQVALGLFCEVSHKRQKLNGLFVKISTGSSPSQPM